VSLSATAVGMAAAADPDQSGQIVALEKKLGAARDEVAALKTALAISKSETAAAETRAKAREKPDSETDSLRTQVRILERDLQSATSALKRVAESKAAADAALAAANQQLAGRTGNAPPIGNAAGAASAGSSAAVDSKIADLQTQLSEARSRVTAAEKNIELRDAELAKVRTSFANAESPPPIPASVTQELAELRNQARVARELEARVRELDREKADLLERLAEAGDSREELSRVTEARAAVEQKLAAQHRALESLIRERDELRVRASRADDRELRARQLESQGATTPASGATVSKEEFARVAAAQAEAESKLSTALRSFTLLTKERDELRARLTELEKKVPANPKNR
ncbi:MAG: hypothetical protein ACREH8_24700, partial [Opitutaceae bacterium]